MTYSILFLVRITLLEFAGPVKKTDGPNGWITFHSSQIWSLEEFHLGGWDREFSQFMNEALCDILGNAKPSRCIHLVCLEFYWSNILGFFLLHFEETRIQNVAFMNMSNHCNHDLIFHPNQLYNFYWKMYYQCALLEIL